MDRHKVEEQPSVRLSDWASLTCSLIWIYDDVVPDYAYDRSIVADEESVVWLVRSGLAEVKTEGMDWRIEPGQWFFLPQQNFWQDFSRGTQILSIRFRATWSVGTRLFPHGQGLKVKADAYPGLETLALPLGRYFKRQFPVQRRNLRAAPATTKQYLKLQSLLMAWLQEYTEVMTGQGVTPTRLSQSDPRVAQLARDLDHWPLDIPLIEDDLAARVNLSGRQLARLFQGSLGVTPSRYLSERKLVMAKNALESNEDTIKEIAYSLGFKSLSYFSSWFSGQCGVPPRQYRQNFQKFRGITKGGS